jgi:hypothetical protein
MSLQDKLDAFRENFEAHRQRYLMAEERVHRRLASILAANVVDYPALMEADA